MWFIVRGTVRGFVQGGVCFGLAVAVEVFRRKSRTKMRLNVSARGIAWIHPDRGSGMMQWTEVGARVLREAEGRSAALCLVPRSRPAEETFVLVAEDFGVGPEEGDVRLRGFVEEIIRFLPSDIVIDRAMKNKLKEWNIRQR